MIKAGYTQPLKGHGDTGKGPQSVSLSNENTLWSGLNRLTRSRPCLLKVMEEALHDRQEGGPSNGVSQGQDWNYVPEKVQQDILPKIQVFSFASSMTQPKFSQLCEGLGWDRANPKELHLKNSGKIVVYATL